MRLLDAPLAIVDLETTGSDPASDRVTEIAVLAIDNFGVTGEWSTLVNPGTGIPGPIQALTGITSEMVAAAPRFAQLAGELYERLDGRVFVAHNARFDYGFLRREFDRAGIRFTAKTLCTVRLSRRLYRGEPHHNLDSVIARHNIDCRARHRAMGDADALWQFLRIVEREHGGEVVDVAARQIAKQPALPPQLDRALVDAVPEAPGVYLFYDEGSTPLYIGKSASMRTRVMSHFTGSGSVELARRVRRIDWKRTAGELGALLLEARLVKELAPEFNRQLRANDGLCGFAFDGRKLRFAGTHEIDGDTLPFVYGVFRSKRAALQALRSLADEHRLCLQALGFESGPRHACFRHQLGKCAGVCAGRESVHLHHARLAAALAVWKAADWPHEGPLGIVEKGRASEETEVHVVDRWCYLGAARSDAEVAELLEGGRRGRFDFDHYRILARHLGKPGVRTVRLAAPCTAS
ncbi:MAG TPA: exonuclease domain-containing protein [Burkholderiales bacterium]